MMKLRMAVARCCCVVDLVHVAFHFAATNQVSLVLMNDTGAQPPAAYQPPFIIGCTTTTLHDLNEYPTDGHPTHIASVLLRDYAIRMSPPPHEERSLYSFNIGSVARSTPFNGTGYDWGPVDVTLLEEPQLPAYPASLGGPKLTFIESMAQANRFLVSGSDWRDENGDVGSTRMMGDQPSGTPGIDEFTLVSATQTLPYWDGQFTPELIAAGGGTMQGAINLFTNVRNGILMNTSAVLDTKPFGSNDGNEVYVLSRSQYATSRADSNGFLWYPVLKHVLVSAYSTSGGTQLSTTPVRQMKYDTLTLNDAAYGTLTNYFIQNYPPSGITDGIYGARQVASTQACIDSTGQYMFFILGMNVQSTLPAANATTADGMISCAVLVKVDLSSMQIVQHLVIDTFMHTTAGTPFVKPMGRLLSLLSTGELVATPQGGVMFLLADWSPPYANRGLFVYDSDCFEIWSYSGFTSSDAYYTYNNRIFLGKHPSEGVNTATVEVDPVTFAIVKEYTGLVVATTTESIEGRIHLR